MNLKAIGGVVAAVGIIGALIGFLVLNGHHHKLFLGAVGLGIVLLIVGVVLLVMPARSVSAS